MPEIIKYIEELEEKGDAYAVDGDVYLRVKNIPEYGELSGNAVEDLESGARIAVESKKEDPLDFALWKKTEEGIKWKTKWGEGRPGWHSECCVMIDSIFRAQDGYIDIHGGGFDLKFPHHENEMAQSKAHNHNKLARYWMHNGFINIDNEKMSKSLGPCVPPRSEHLISRTASFPIIISPRSLEGSGDVFSSISRTFFLLIFPVRALIIQPWRLYLNKSFRRKRANSVSSGNTLLKHKPQSPKAPS